MIALMILAAAGVAAPEEFVGRWQTSTKHGVVEIVRCGASICGTLVDSDGIRANPQLRDLNNKDSSQRTRALKGLMILKGFSWKSGTWAGGTIYNGDDGGTYSATLTAEDHNQIKLKGCIVWPLCKTQIWTRIH